MENLEKRIRRTIKTATIKNTVLGLAAGTGILAIGAIVPGVFKMLKYLNADKLVFNKKRQAIYNVIQRLKKDGLLKEQYKNGKKFLEITENGKKYFEVLQIINKPKKKNWDKKLRIVIFDIEEKYKNIREKVRRELAQYGFLKLQNSVWVYPFPCEDYIALLKADNKVGKHLLYMIVDEIENRKIICEHFNLKNI